MPVAEEFLDDGLSFEQQLQADLAFERALKAQHRGPQAAMLGKPEMMVPSSSAAVLNNLVCREILYPSGPLDPPSPTITSLQETVKAISLGTDISPHKANIQRIASNQPEKADVIQAHLNQYDYEKIATLVTLEDSALRVIKRAGNRNDVTVGEALVVWRTCREDLPSLRRSLSENDKAVDTVTVCEKIDYKRQQVERSVAKRWEGTTPQGRELIRKKLWVIQREMKAKLGVFPPGIDPVPIEDSETEVPVPAS